MRFPPESNRKLTSIVLGRDVIRQIVIEDKTQQAIQERQVDFFINLRKHSLHHDHAFAFAGFPDVGQVINPLAPLRYEAVN
jgi:hypothetical protein